MIINEIEKGKTDNTLKSTVYYEIRMCMLCERRLKKYFFLCTSIQYFRTLFNYFYNIDKFKINLWTFKKCKILLFNKKLIKTKNICLF